MPTPEPERTGTMPVAEIVTFRLRPGADVAAFLRSAGAIDPAIAAQPGFLRRTLGRDPDGLWTDYVEWADLARAQAAATAITAEPEFAAFADAIDLGGAVMRHSEILLAMDD